MRFGHGEVEAIDDGQQFVTGQQLENGSLHRRVKTIRPVGRRRGRKMTGLEPRQRRACPGHPA